MSKLLKSVSAVFFAIFFIVILNITQVFANSDVKFHLEPSNNNPVLSEDFTVNVFVEPSSEVNIATFLLKINFD